MSMKIQLFEENSTMLSWHIELHEKAAHHKSFSLEKRVKKILNQLQITKLILIVQLTKSWIFFLEARCFNSVSTIHEATKLP